MATFDFIVSKDFRRTIEGDYGELQAAALADCHKSVHVLAGSIVEALLVDYIVAASLTIPKGKDALRLDLGDAVAICHDAGVLTDRTADLCSVIKSYRNLIHPARMIRLNESTPTKNTAHVSTALVEIIIEELVKKLRATQGLTADQLLSKIKKDDGSVAILPHLLSEVSESERERMLLDLMPAAYAEEENDRDSWMSGKLGVLRQAFRVILNSAQPTTRARVAEDFVRIIKVEDGATIERYRTAFFRVDDIKFINEKMRPMVVHHLLGGVGLVHTQETLEMIDGISKYLDGNSVHDWLDPLVKTLVAKKTSEAVKELAVQQIFSSSSTAMNDEIDKMVDRRLDSWEGHYNRNGQPEAASVVHNLKDGLLDWRQDDIPF